MQLNDEELTIVLALAEPIDQRRRPEFLAAVAAELEAEAVHGPGAAHRVGRAIQRKYFEPPQFRETLGPRLEG
jgi:hypothetical protein